MQIPAMYKILTDMLEILTDLISQGKKSKKCPKYYRRNLRKIHFWKFWGQNTLDYGKKKSEKMLDIIGAICEKNYFWAFGKGHISRYFVEIL